MMDDTREIIEETIISVKEINKKVLWVGSYDGEYAISWEEFCKLKPQKYYSGFGEQEIAHDLVVVFEDGSYLERYEYDGSECWHYKKTPQISNNPKKFKKLKGCYSALKNINND
jgi:hypothetical protein